MSIVLYTARTQESVVLDDASTSSAFGGDEYIQKKHVRSALCVPLIKQGRAVAFLYLENNLASRVFTPARIAILKFLHPRLRPRSTMPVCTGSFRSGS